MKTIDCPFCHKEVDEDSTTCPQCRTGLGKKAKSHAQQKAGKSSCGSGDQARRTEGEYEGGYVD